MMDAEERELFVTAVGAAVAGRTGADLDAASAQLGWDDALAADGQAAVGVLFEAQGRAGATSGAVDHVLCGALGRAPMSVVLPPLGRTAPPGRVDGDAIAVRGLVVGGLFEGDDVLVVAAEPDGTRSVHVIAGLEARAVRGLDPQLGLVAVTGTHPRASTRPSSSGAGADVGEGLWDTRSPPVSGRLPTSWSASPGRCSTSRRRHALDRIQFDVPIASFQAVRHRLADAYVAIESAAAVADAVWEQPGPLTAAAAKAIAGRSARLVAKHCQQVLAGIGFTAEHPFHRYLRRARLLDGLLGDSRAAHPRPGRGAPPRSARCRPSFRCSGALTPSHIRVTVLARNQPRGRR